jgi:CRP-like cAMP-binding protein
MLHPKASAPKRPRTHRRWVSVPNPKPAPVTRLPLPSPAVDSPTFLDVLSPSARDALLAAGRLRRYPKGSLVFAAGDEGHDVLIIQSGAVKVVVGAPNGREVILDVLHAGELLGELSAVDGGPRSATVFALESTEVLVVAHRTFRTMLANHASIGDALLTVLAVRLRCSGLRQLEFGSNDALGRLCQRIIEMGNRYGQSDDHGRLVVEVPFSQTDLANWAGLSREAVVKGLRSLRTLGWIESDGKQIVVVDDKALRDRGNQ